MRRILACVLAFVLLTVPLAQAGSEPVVYFLERGDLTSLIEGHPMNADAPEDEVFMVHPVTLGTEDLPSIRFAPDDTEHPDWLLGPMFAALWRGQEAVNDGNMTAVLYEEHSDDTRTVIARSSQHVNTSEDPDQVPEPEQLVPPDPTDPQSSALHVAGQLLPLVFEPVMVFNFGFVNHQLDEGSTISVGFYLEMDEDGNVPAGTIPLEYDGTLAPSYIYTPWFVPEPTPDDDGDDQDQGNEPPDTGGSQDDGQDDSDDPDPGSEPADEESPGIGIMALLALVSAAFIVARRRQ